MRVLLQRVTEAAVRVDGAIVGATGPGLLVLVCGMRDDTDQDADFLAAKIAKLRVFADDNGKTNLSVMDVAGTALVISQFTLAANWRKGNRPGFSAAAGPQEGERLYDHFCARLRETGLPIETGTFGADMSVALVNDGPFTIWMDSRD